MIKHTSHLIILFAIAALTSCGERQEWELVWSDDFNYQGLPDPEKWTYDTGYIANNEKQYYTSFRPENARVDNGYLVIEARKEEWNGFDYTSARLITRGIESWTYGRFEARAKLPTGRGTWPAFWMLGTNIGEVGWPLCGEIDIMENVGYDPKMVHGYVHTAAYNHMRGTQKGGSVELERPWDEFHIYAVEWFEDRIDFFIDDLLYFTFKKESDEDDVWPFNKPHYLLLNLAIGGNWGGQQGIDDSIFPQQYIIDYVRVYRRN